ncbi:hypothetical protein HYE68_000489 [Fusarium pseudograminearum]|nr:hypothetical protein HYE68_000489 [Fusarium pseudograminearum]
MAPRHNARSRSRAQANSPTDNNEDTSQQQDTGDGLSEIVLTLDEMPIPPPPPALNTLMDSDDWQLGELVLSDVY